jgi:hypothetical protein
MYCWNIGQPETKLLHAFEDHTRVLDGQVQTHIS